MKFVQSYYLARLLYKQTLEIQNYAVIFYYHFQVFKEELRFKIPE